jgi:BA14K-like protein
MLRTLSAIGALALACAMPLQQAAAQDPLAGGIFGGAAGAIIGGAIGGRNGAIAGAIIGGSTGAAIASQGQRRANGYYWYNNGCFVQRPDGAWINVNPQYCGGPGYGPPPAAAYGPPPVPAAAYDPDDEDGYGNPPAGAYPRRGASQDAVEACAARYRSYDRNSMTFLSNDGTRKPCPSY